MSGARVGGDTDSDRDAAFQVFDHSWKYTADSEPCMQLWFDPSQGNPNALVARLRAEQLAAGGGRPLPVLAGALPLLLRTAIQG